jgi:hypothetical protein
VVFADWSYGSQRVAVIAFPETAPSQDLNQTLSDLLLIGVRKYSSINWKPMRVCDTFEAATMTSVDIDTPVPQRLTMVTVHGGSARYEVLYWRPAGSDADASIAGAIYHFCVPGQR